MNIDTQWRLFLALFARWFLEMQLHWICVHKGQDHMKRQVAVEKLLRALGLRGFQLTRGGFKFTGLLFVDAFGRTFIGQRQHFFQNAFQVIRWGLLLQQDVFKTACLAQHRTFEHDGVHLRHGTALLKQSFDQGGHFTLATPHAQPHVIHQP